MLWSFIAVCFSAWLYVDASYRGPAWRRWVFKPVTLILLLLLAWQAPMFNAISYLVLAGLCASLLGDALTLLLLSNAVWLVSHYRRRFRADNAIAAAFYFAGHFLIVRALYL
ncbi:lysoplasmalogenase family protein [Klebsiella pneumoniae]|uniref:lysoplasmalogenase family protein n=1 Tax=Klebsiella pneumoniae TaxID=573 RepID=UPI002406DF42|nr:lysoplasmalogenase family protein [Klebsiella pneumoniae]MDG0588367.1 lysoplasmalogenase family protein [Klebsiella pneumoniae]